MALEKNFTMTGHLVLHVDGHGEVSKGSTTETFQNVYVVVHDVRSTKTEARASVHFRTGNGSWTKVYKFVPDVSESADNFIRQAYIHLKTLEEFSDARDV